jgi:hypothetical protein
MLFGHARLGASSFIPCLVDAFARRTRGHLGSAEEIIRHHTPLALFLPFLSNERADWAVHRAYGEDTRPLKLTLGLSKLRGSTSLALRSCARCDEADRARFGTGYWHLVHQLPCVWMCPEHHELLSHEISSPLPGWQLPGLNANALKPATRLEFGDRQQLLKLACIAQEIALLPAHHCLEWVPLRATFLRRLARGPVDAEESGARLESAKNDFALYLASIAQFCPVLEVSGALKAAGSLVTKHIGAGCPVRRLERNVLFIGWLFADWADFIAAYATESTKISPIAPSVRLVR